jgi:hypothetical protein
MGISQPRVKLIRLDCHVVLSAVNLCRYCVSTNPGHQGGYLSNLSEPRSSTIVVRLHSGFTLGLRPLRAASSIGASLAASVASVSESGEEFAGPCDRGDGASPEATGPNSQHGGDPTLWPPMDSQRQAMRPDPVPRAADLGSGQGPRAGSPGPKPRKLMIAHAVAS